MAHHKAKLKKLSELPVTALVESMTHDGRGVARVDGKPVFIDAALPGEQVDFVYTDSRRDYAEGKMVHLHSRSPDRTEPLCQHYAICGGCSFQHVAPDAQIRIKQALLTEQFKRIGKLDIPDYWPPMNGPPWGYRRKARMGAKYVLKKNRMLVGFREKRKHYLAEIDTCAVLHPTVGSQLPALAAMLESLSIREHIPQIEVAVGDDQCVLAIRVMQPPTDADIEILRAFGRQYGMILCLQPKGPNSIMPLPGEPEFKLTYALPDHGIEFMFRPAMFTQVNYAINRQMINRVLEALELQSGETVLDLFCGLGNFTLPLAKKAGRVVGVEGDEPLVEHARSNARYNGIANADFYTADLTREISALPWAQQRYDKLLLDPSRAGAAEILAQVKVWRPKRIVYVSCNPSTLARDAGILVNGLGYRLAKAGVMDMFPHTAHVESMALFLAG
jgi:23S rRNA (uracil1939-C5)-methyltransferase